MNTKNLICRAKRIDNGEWVEGYVYEHQPPLTCFAEDKKEEPQWYILKTAFADWNMPRQVDFIRVDPKTIGQYTGMMEDEQCIFDGDLIMDVTTDKVYIVKHKRTAFYAVRNGIEILLSEIVDDCVINGNIYDNPELLESQNRINIRHWEKCGNIYKLHFTQYHNDKIVAELSLDEDGNWTYDSAETGKECVFLEASDLEAAKIEVEESITNYYTKRLDGWFESGVQE